ncbi:MAG: hypothetical protein WBQ49_01185, partial [Rhodomicrobium sp.]
PITAPIAHRLSSRVLLEDLKALRSWTMVRPPLCAFNSHRFCGHEFAGKRQIRGGLPLSS